MDFAIQVSPDHPWVTEHPEWFYHRPDGTIKFAENPPKKYEDIYPLNFHCEDWRALWAELRDVILFWARRGVRIYRVDNPHTKPLDFWAWMIREVQQEFPDTVFLAEAFTRPKVMKALAKAGFTQSYTYFTWRNERKEIEEYLTEITSPPVTEYFRGNLFVNTPDILPEILVKGGRPAFIMRLVLAATVGSTYGMYNGYELCENTPRYAGSEYYLDSEMYQHKVWDWDRPGNIVDIVTRVNRIRAREPGPAPVQEPALLRLRGRAHPVLRQGDARQLEHHPGGDEPGPVRDAPRRRLPAAGRAWHPRRRGVRGRGSADRRDVLLVRPPQLGPPGPAGAAGAHLAGEPTGTAGRRDGHNHDVDAGLRTALTLGPLSPPWERGR